MKRKTYIFNLTFLFEFAYEVISTRFKDFFIFFRIQGVQEVKVNIVGSKALQLQIKNFRHVFCFIHIPHGHFGCQVVGAAGMLF